MKRGNKATRGDTVRRAVPTTTNGITTILARLLDAYTHLDAEEIATHYAEDCVVDSPVAGMCVGRLAVERSLRTVFSAFPDFSIHTDEL